MTNLSWIEIIYWGSTVIGGTLFILRTILLVIGGGLGGGDLDADFGGDIHIDGDLHIENDVLAGVDHTDTLADTDFSFKLLSMQGLTAFFMMFGLVGLALLKMKLAIFITILGGGFAGLFAVWVISLLFVQMQRFQSDGTLQIQNAMGQSGSVYLGIPTEGSGQVRVSVQGRMKIFDAVAIDGQTIGTGEKIRVAGIINSSTLSVEKIN